MRRRAVVEALKIWGMKPKKVRRVRSVFKVKTDQGTFCLKPTYDHEERLRFQNSVLDYVQKQGFTELAPLIVTPQGEPFGVYEEDYLVLTPWLPSKEISYYSFHQVMKATHLLGRFHLVSEGYRPDLDITLRDKHGKWPEKLARRCGDIEYYLELAQKGRGRFDRLFLGKANWILDQSLAAFHALRDSNYYQLVEESRERVQLCHGDPSKRNFVIDQNGKVYMIDFDSLKMDLPVVDLWRFLRRVMMRNWSRWKIEELGTLIAAYNQSRALSKGELELLGIFLTFPEKIWRVLKKYYEHQGRDGWSEARYYKKLQKLLVDIEARERVLGDYRYLFLNE